MTIHNLLPDANILFASESIVDILGYQPDEVRGKSCFEFFHPDEVPFARAIHVRGILLDKAAVLHYLRVKAQDGQWVSCECCFTVVHDVLVACTSIYRKGAKSDRRAIEAPQIRRIFSCSPRDPRYHMLEHLSPKFKMPPMEREPRAALILNRFTRSLKIMFATNAVSTILGVTPDQIHGKDFYECIAPNCLADAIRCLESAKANDSIAYLRFWYRDPRTEEDFDDEEMDEDGDEDVSNNSDSDGGAHLDSSMDVDSDHQAQPEIKSELLSPEPLRAGLIQPANSGSSSSANFSFDDNRQTQRPASGQQAPRVVSRPSPSPAPRQEANRRRRREPIPSFELEAVVSCTSDGLVVVLRKARPPIPTIHPPLLPVDYENGLFAAPWGSEQISPYYQPNLFHQFRPPLLPQYMPLQEHVKAAGGPPLDQLMRSIRDVAVFAWALVGINGNLAQYSRGTAEDEAQPPDGLPIWEPTAGKTSYLGPENQASIRWSRTTTTIEGTAPYMSGVTTDASHYGATPAGFDNRNYPFSHQPSWHPSGTSYPRQNAMNPYGQVPPQQPSLGTSYHNLGIQEPWQAEASARRSPHNDSYAIPTTQGPSHGSSSEDRHMW